MFDFKFAFFVDRSSSCLVILVPSAVYSLGCLSGCISTLVLALAGLVSWANCYEKTWAHLVTAGLLLGRSRCAFYRYVLATAAGGPVFTCYRFGMGICMSCW